MVKTSIMQRISDLGGVAKYWKNHEKANSLTLRMQLTCKMGRKRLVITLGKPVKGFGRKRPLNEASLPYFMVDVLPNKPHICI